VLPQVREAYAVLGGQPPDCWGYEFGLNECQLAVGCIDLTARETEHCPSRAGPEMVRVALERCHGARQAVDLLTDLLDRMRHEKPVADYAFTVADAEEAYAVETVDCHWVYQEVREVRAASGVRIIGQDWDRISHGLADHAIAQGWWPADGSKLDFRQAVHESLESRRDPWRRWSRATLLLHEQNEHIELAFIRRVLCDHGTNAEARQHGALCRHGEVAGEDTTVASFVALLDRSPASTPMAWCAFGPPCRAVYFSLYLDGKIPDPFLNGASVPSLPTGCQALPGIVRLQESIDQKTAEFVADARRLKEQGCDGDLRHQTSVFMQHQLEQFDAARSDWLRTRAELRGPIGLRRPLQEPEASDSATTAYFG
jgi:hypothetical protein